MVNLSAEGSAIFRCELSVQSHAPWGWVGSYFPVSPLSQQAAAWLACRELNHVQTSPPSLHRNTSSVLASRLHRRFLIHRIKQQFCVGWGHFSILVRVVCHMICMGASVCKARLPSETPTSANCRSACICHTVSY